MKTIPHIQGSPEWAAVRQTMRPASEASAMMGQSKYLSRTDLLKQRKTGITKEVDGFKQALFDKGHATEASARAILEEQLGEELYPIVGADDAGYLMASFDGIDMLGTTGFEHKLYSESLAAQVRAGQLDMHYVWQLEQQILVGGLEKIIFVCSDGTRDKWEQMEYRAQSGLAEKLLAGWQQFDIDLAAYVPTETAAPVVAAPIMDLPAITVSINGELVIRSNLDVWGPQLHEFVARIPKAITTDQELADGKAAVAALKKAKDQLKAEEARVLGSVPSIDDFKRQSKLLQDTADAARLALEKLVASSDEQNKREIITTGRDALAEHIAQLNIRLGRALMPRVAEDFAGVIKGKRNYDSMRNAVSDELARCKLEANAIADKIQINLNAMGDDKHLFPDLAGVCHHDAAIFSSLLAQRKQEQADRVAAAVAASESAAAAQKARAEELARQAEATAAAARQVAEQTTVAAEPAAIIPKAVTPSDEAVVLGGKTVAIPMHTGATGSGLLRDQIDDVLAEFTIPQLQQALDALRAIRARRAA